VSWSSVSGATQYCIYRDGVPQGCVSGTSWRDNDPGAGQRCYTVTSKNECGEGDESSPPQCCTAKFELPPPSSCAASDDLCDKVNFCWQDNSEDEDGFKIYRDGVYLGSVGADVECYDDLTASPGVTYSYCVKAYNECGESEECCDNGIRLTPPADPSDCEASDDLCDKVHFCWQDNSDNEDGFKIYRNGVYLGSVGADVECYDDNTASPGVEYEYCVRAYDECGESGECCDNGLALGPPAAPTACDASDDLCDKVRFCWQDNSDNEDGFYIYRDGIKIGEVGADVTCYDDNIASGAGPVLVSPVDGDLNASSPVTLCFAPGVGATYSYCVRAYNECGESGQCCDDGGRFTPQPDKYWIQVDDDPDFASPLVFDANTIICACVTFDGLEPNTEYYWRVKAHARCGWGNWSGPWRFAIFTTDVEEIESDQLPMSYSLAQNYPNPFNARTEIRFTVPDHVPVTITVYDVLGREVVVLAKREELSPGLKSVAWDGLDFRGSPVPSGIYFYRITAGNFTEAKKMVLMK